MLDICTGLRAIKTRRINKRAKATNHQQDKNNFFTHNIPLNTYIFSKEYNLPFITAPAPLPAYTATMAPKKTQQCVVYRFALLRLPTYPA